MRVVAGSAKGRKLHTIKGLAVRPTADKVKQAIFNTLEPEWTGKRVLDLFAGTGGLGIEALSRGAEFAVFVDESRKAEAAIRRNITDCELGTRADVFKLRFTVALERLKSRGDRFNVVFLDPPYGKDAVYHALQEIVAVDILAEQAVIVAEHAKGDKVRPDVLGLRLTDSRHYGSTTVSYIGI